MGAFIARRKGRITLAALMLSALVAAIIALRSTQPAQATSDGDPYVVPIAMDTNPDPDIFETTIVAEAKTVNIGNGVMANMLTFNGTVPGPEFHLHVDETVIVHFENNIAHATGIHWHGIKLDNESDGTPLTQNQGPPNEKVLYKFKVTRPGMFWYHPHHHSSTNQVFKGLYGTIIITDPNEQTLVGSGVLPPASQTRTLALSDVTVCANVNTGEQLNLCETNPLDEDGNARLPVPGPFLPGDVPNIQKPGTSGPVREGNIVLTNGKNVGGRAGTPDAPGALNAGASTLDVIAGQGYRFRIGSESTIRFFRLRLTGSDGTSIVQVPLVRVGGQGGLLDHGIIEGGTVGSFHFDYDAGEILLDPGDRVDVVAVFPPTATGDFTLWTKDFPRTGQGNANVPTVPVAHFHIAGSVGPGYTMTGGTPVLTSIGQSVEVLGAATGSLLDPGTFSPAKPGTPNQDIQLTNTGSSLGINDIIGKHDFPGVDYIAIPRPIDPMTMASSARYAKLGDVLELTVTNVTGAHHPFHLHGFSIQPISLTRGAVVYNFPYHEFRDNIDIPGFPPNQNPPEMEPGYTLRLRVRLDDRMPMDGVTPGGGLGRWAFHCHIFFHASFGMISEFDVVAPDGNERPYINANDVVVEGNSGATLTMHGTFKDPDGDTPIALSASTGSIADDGDGKHWTWTGSASSIQLVYVTATDPGGLTGQTAFGLKINQPPVLPVPGPQSQAYHDLLSFGISATDPDDDPITLGASGLPSGLALVDHGDGTGTVSGTLTATPGVYVATFSASDGHNPAVTKTVQITVTKEETTLTYTGPTVILNGGNVTLSAALKEDGLVPIAGRTVSFTFGAQVCSGSTIASGVASCTVLANSALGTSIPITATFVGDAFYLPSSDSATAVVFAFPSRGAFIVGDVSAAGGGTVTWWDSSWSKANVLSGGAGPSSFKGFAGTVSLPTSTPPAACGGPWSTAGGNSPPPTDVVPSFMGALVASSATKSGTIISGNTVKIIVVQVAPGFQSNSGSTGAGTIIATYFP